MKKNLLIIGAGGHGRCCLDIARESGEYNWISFLDDNAVGKIINGVEVIDSISNLDKYCGEYQCVFPAIGNNKFRKELQLKAQNMGFTIPTLLSKRSSVSDYTTIGVGTVVFPGVVIEANVSIGEGCILTSNATVNHDAQIKDFSLIYSNTVIRPEVVVETLVRIGSGCVIRFGMTIKSESDIPEGIIV